MAADLYRDYCRSRRIITVDLAKLFINRSIYQYMYVGGWLAGPGRDLLGQLCGGLLRRCSPWRKIKKGGVGEGGDWVYHLKPIFP